MGSQIVENSEQMPNPQQNSRNQRLGEMLARAAAVMGSVTDAENWMARPALGLDGRRPIDLLESDAGSGLVKEFLTRVEHGVYV